MVGQTQCSKNTFGVSFKKMSYVTEGTGGTPSLLCKLLGAETLPLAVKIDKGKKTREEHFPEKELRQNDFGHKNFFEEWGLNPNPTFATSLPLIDHSPQ